jgi:MOSC domain-containing protein YiiM
MHGLIRSINISEKTGEIKQPVSQAELIPAYGIKGDAHAGSTRQVSLLAEESIAKIRTAAVQLEPGVFAENLTVEGIQLWELPLKTQFKIGDHVILELTQIGKACHHGCRIRELVGDCVMPREGVFAAVIQGGHIFVGDKIWVLKTER